MARSICPGQTRPAECIYHPLNSITYLREKCRCWFFDSTSADPFLRWRHWVESSDLQGFPLWRRWLLKEYQGWQFILSRKGFQITVASRLSWKFYSPIQLLQHFQSTSCWLLSHIFEEEKNWFSTITFNQIDILTLWNQSFEGQSSGLLF